MAQLLGEEPAVAEGLHSDATTDSRLDPTRMRLLDAMSTKAGRSPDALATISGLAPDRVRAELGLLELEGLVRLRPSGWIRTLQPTAAPT